jgi:hypothetical protein
MSDGIDGRFMGLNTDGDLPPGGASRALREGTGHFVRVTLTM